MSAITSLRGAIEGVTNEAEDRVIGVLEATRGAVVEFVSAIFAIAEVLARQIVQIFFDLGITVVSQVFNVADAIVTAALGAVGDEYKAATELYITGDFGTVELDDDSKSIEEGN